MGSLEDAILGRQSTEDDPDNAPVQLFEGKIKTVTPQGISFVIPNWDGGQFEFGPMPYPGWVAQPAGSPSHTHTLVGPAVGNVCLVAFLGGNSDPDSQVPWVLGWRSS